MNLERCSLNGTKPLPIKVSLVSYFLLDLKSENKQQTEEDKEESEHYSQYYDEIDRGRNED